MEQEIRPSLEDSLSFWRSEGENLARDLLGYIRALSTKISNTSKTFPFYLYLNWREMTGSDWFILRIASHFLEQGPLILELLKDSLLNFVFKELKEGLARNQDRMKNIKFKQFELALSWAHFDDQRSIFTKSILPSEREWRGNFAKKLPRILERIFTLRFQTPKRIERQERVRGYRDHGSKASDSEIARRQANTSGWNPWLEFAKSLVVEYHYSISEALRIAFGEQRRI